MTKIIGIVAGEPNSIASEIIFKTWLLKKRFPHKPFIVIGSIDLLNLQKKKLNFKIKIKKINNELNFKKIKKNELPVYDIKFKQKKPFEKVTIKSSKYIIECFNAALSLIKKKKIFGLINCPVSKETLFINKHQGITEFLSKKLGKSGNEVMLLFNKKLSVSPLTTHLEIKNVSKNIIKSKIFNKIKIINNFYKKILRKKPKIAVLGLNPHNFYSKKMVRVKKVILKNIKKAKKLNINLIGPISPDTSFMFYEYKKFDVIIGMYHDQVLTPFKALFKYNAINITLGLPFIRLSPDHGIASDIVGKKIANPESLVQSIKFFNYIK